VGTRKFLKRYPEAILLSLAFLLLPAGNTWAHAAASSCGGGSKFDGYIYSPDPTDFKVRGAQADISVQVADLCPAAQFTSLAWDMVAAHDNSGWAQIGYIQKNSGAYLNGFWQWTQGGGGGLFTGYFNNGDITYDGTVLFLVARGGNDGLLHMKYTDSLVEPHCNMAGVCPVTDFDPLSAWSGNPVADYAGEVIHPGDDVPGTSGNRTNFTNVRDKDQDGNWSSQGFTYLAAGIPCYFKNNLINNAHVQLWTDPLNHSC
jgi:hypothetical protein